ncbi:ABC transporter ATP-binding protein [Solwaraspora sp. WMMD406]|uniref:ATP-binding cassette domain-containing protein n=1 Tax=Solwaraspora sp. WMMD406 TaxID=3016095 RepID=UPI00241787D1|nr:ABC transporter ATP-binding protein [Solwaraspora sp. WMMD406]MDG4766100.1 ABC transporter ATP-binding protein [Solwaraspora sp. WMMD406]
MDATELDRRRIRPIRDSGGWTVLLGLTALLGGTAEVLLPAALGRALDAAITGAGAGWLAAAAALVGVIVCTDTVGGLAGGYGVARATARLRGRLIRHIVGLAPGTAARHPAGDLVTRLVGQAADAGHAGTALVLGVTAVVPMLGSVVALALLDLWLGVTFVAGLTLLTLLLRSFVTDAGSAMDGYLRTQGLIAGHLVEALSGARTIAAAGTTAAEADRVLAPLPVLHGHGRRTWLVLARASGRTAALAPVLQLAVVAVAGFGVAAGRLTPGQLFAAMQYAALGAGLGAVVSSLNQLVRARSGARRAAEILAEPAMRHGTAHLPAGPGELVFDEVCVTAPDGRTILDRVNLRVDGGRTVAVVGASGAGKSTLAALAGRLRDPDHGQVRLDGTPLTELDRDTVRRAIGIGFERPILTGDTIGEVIGLGRDPFPVAEARRLARAAAIDDFVARLPDGYRTPLAQAPMSGGEAQRLGLARALRADRLLVLDDATSSLDTLTEHRISAAVAGAADGRTRLVVTHRVAVAAAADLVVWLDAGRIRAVGHHRDLWYLDDYRAVFATTAPARTTPPLADLGEHR